MPPAPQTCVLLLRAVNVGKRQLPMAALREIAEELGFAEPRTFQASGNLVARVRGTPSAAAQRLEAAVKERFGFHSDVIVRTAAQWAAYVDDNPFADACASEPNRVMLLLANRTPSETTDTLLAERAGPGERVQTVRDGLWIHYANSIHASKLTPTLIDKCVGAPATGRNWRTVQGLARMLEEVA